jgi:hypothetical protein
MGTSGSGTPKPSGKASGEEEPVVQYHPYEKPTMSAADLKKFQDEIREEANKRMSDLKFDSDALYKGLEKSGEYSKLIRLCTQVENALDNGMFPGIDNFAAFDGSGRANSDIIRSLNEELDFSFTAMKDLAKNKMDLSTLSQKQINAVTNFPELAITMHNVFLSLNNPVLLEAYDGRDFNAHFESDLKEATGIAEKLALAPGGLKDFSRSVRKNDAINEMADTPSMFPLGKAMKRVMLTGAAVAGLAAVPFAARVPVENSRVEWADSAKRASDAGNKDLATSFTEKEQKSESTKNVLDLASMVLLALGASGVIGASIKTAYDGRRAVNEYKEMMALVKYPYNVTRGSASFK